MNFGRLSRDESGSAVVEFAVLLPLLAVLLFGIVEFSLLLYDKAMITNASREGARSGIVARFDSVTGNYSPLTSSEIEAVVNAYAGAYLVSFSAGDTLSTQVTYVDEDTSGDLTSGDTRVVTVTWPYSYLLIPNFITAIAGTINLQAQTRMRME